MLGSGRMAGAPDAVFDVADRRVDPLEGGDLDGLGAPAGDDGLVAAARLGDGAATHSEVQELREEGIEFGELPLLPELDG